MTSHTNNNSILSKGKLMDSQRGNNSSIENNQGVDSTKNHKRNNKSVKRASTINNEIDSMEIHSSTLSGRAGNEIEMFSNGGRRGTENQFDYIMDRETILNSSSGAMQAANQ